MSEDKLVDNKTVVLALMDMRLTEYNTWTKKCYDNAFYLVNNRHDFDAVYYRVYDLKGNCSYNLFPLKLRHDCSMFGEKKNKVLKVYFILPHGFFML